MENMILDICENNYTSFLDKSNVVGVGLGSKVANGIDTGIPCLTVFVTKKLSKNQLRREDLIETSYYQNIKTDVIEVDEIKAEAFTSKVRPMLSGYSIGPANLMLAGTAGCIVKDSLNNYYILSNNHVIAGENQLPIGTQILQPALLDGGISATDTIAALAKFIPIQFETPTLSPINQVDAAIARVLVKSSVSLNIALIGKIAGINLLPKVNLNVKKVGRTTQLTTGKIMYLGATIRVSYSNNKTALFTNQIITTAMSKAGDSGSVVLDNSNNLVGLLFAGSTSTTVLNPISTVLSSLGVSIAQ